jgi:hypothetical protein
VQLASETNDKPAADVVQASKLPELDATSYRAMYTNGMHFRIKDAEEEKFTCDSAIASAVWRRRRTGESAMSGEIESVEYVGWIEEILELDYRTHCCIVLVCSWIPTTLQESNPKLFRDKYGFAVANFINTSKVGAHCFAFPTQCRQVFFSSDRKYSQRHGGDWKVICGTDVRGRRGDMDSSQPEIGILAPGRDSDHEGLRLLPVNEDASENNIPDEDVSF